jgi:glutathione S-transferase
MTAVAVELIQFPYSHYNEKVRWALTHKGVPHRRRSLLPGPHAAVVLWLTGQTQTPVVRFGDQVVHGSARILDELERRWPDPALYPAEPALRRRALELQAWLDAEVGPLVRRALFSILTAHPDFVCAMFAGDRSAAVRLAYRAAFPLTRLAMKGSMGIRDAASVDEGFAGTQAALDRVAREVVPGGYLVGDAFSVADLTAAALLVPTVRVSHPAMALPEPMPAPLEHWYARWASHPGAAWVREQYRNHREPEALPRREPRVGGAQPPGGQPGAA